MAFKKISALYFMADSTEDLINLPDVQMGATCFVITEACEYKSTSDGEWIKQVNFASNGNGNTADLTGYATQSYVNEKIGNLVSSAPENLDTLAELATAFKDNKNVLEVLNEAIGNKAEKTDIPDVSNLQPKGDYALKSELPSTSGFATEEFVANKIAEAELNNKDVDLSGYYTKSEVDNKIADIEHPVPDLSGYVTNEELLEAVGNINIPSIEGLASEEYVDEAIAGIDHPTIDLSDYALKEEIPSIEGLASEGYVNNAVDNIVHPSVDLSGFATKSYVQKAIEDISVDDAAHSFMIPNPVDKSYYAGKKIACIGDSVTAGVGANGNPYVTQLGTALGATMVNLGASGTVLCTGGHRGCNIGKLSESSLGGADIVTILMGINDWDQAKADYYDLGDINSTDTSTIYGAVKMWCDRIIELKNTASLAHTKFYFMTPLQTSWNHSKGSNSWDQNKVNIHGFKLRDLCQAIIDVCALYKIPVIDLNLYSGIYYNSADDQTTSSLGLTLTLKQVSLSSLLGLIQSRIGSLLLSILTSFRSLLNFGFQSLFLDSDLTLLKFNFLLLASNIGFGSRNISQLTLFLKLDGLSCISLSLSSVLGLLQSGTLHFQSVVLDGDFLSSLDLSVIGSLSVSSLSNRNFTLGVRLSNRSILTNLLNVVNTQVINYATLVREVLNVEGNQFQTELGQVRNHIRLNSVAERLTIRNHLSQLHLTDDFADVTFQQVIDLGGNYITLNVQEVLSRNLNHIIGSANLDGNSRVNLYVNVFSSRNCGLGLNVNLDGTKSQLIQSFEERNLKASLTNQDSGLLVHTRDDVGDIRGEP